MCCHRHADVQAALGRPVQPQALCDEGGVGQDCPGHDLGRLADLPDGTYLLSTTAAGFKIDGVHFEVGASHQLLSVNEEALRNPVTNPGGAVFAADVTFLSLGRVDELWDEIAIAAYPERGAMVRMSMSPEWREISVHRTAGLKGQLNIESVLTPGMTPDWLARIAAEVGSGS